MEGIGPRAALSVGDDEEGVEAAEELSGALDHLLDGRFDSAGGQRVDLRLMRRDPLPVGRTESRLRAPRRIVGRTQDSESVPDRSPRTPGLGPPAFLQGAPEAFAARSPSAARPPPRKTRPMSRGGLRPDLGVVEDVLAHAPTGPAEQPLQGRVLGGAPTEAQ